MNDTSIRKRLLIGVIGALLITWVIVISLVYRSSKHEIAEVYDASLASYARVLATLMSHEAKEEFVIQQKLKQIVQELGVEMVKSSQTLSEVISKNATPNTTADYLTLEPAKTSHVGHQYESKIAFLIKAADGRVLLRSSTEAPFNKAVNGFQSVNYGNDSWRLFGLTEKKNAITVMVGEKIEVRRELQQDILTNVLWPLVFILPVIALLLFYIISKGLKPLLAVAEKVSRRSPLSLEPISRDATPVEVLPLVDEINHLFKRIEQALENERRFTANAAHELRTPLAAIKTRVQVLQLSASPELETDINNILASVDRTTHLIEQLLTLARAEAKSHSGIEFTVVGLASLARSMLKDMSNQALSKNIDLSFEDKTDNEKIQSDEALLQIIIRNILDNAIKYTPANGSVKVSLKKAAGKLQFSVEDSGQGLLQEQQELMFQRFQRGSNNGENGVGLGLFIVRQTTNLLDIKIKLEPPSSEHGFIFSLIFS